MGFHFVVQLLLSMCLPWSVVTTLSVMPLKKTDFPSFNCYQSPIAPWVLSSNKNLSPFLLGPSPDDLISHEFNSLLALYPSIVTAGRGLAFQQDASLVCGTSWFHGCVKHVI